MKVYFFFAILILIKLFDSEIFKNTIVLLIISLVLISLFKTSNLKRKARDSSENFFFISKKEKNDETN